MKRLLITAGPTHEAINAVRYIANRSSGRLGAALAEAARDSGWEVTLLLGPVSMPAPAGVRAEFFTSTSDLEGLLTAHFSNCDVLIMAAAVADFRPVKAAKEKLQRSSERMVIELEPTPDLVMRLAAQRKNQYIVGFALEEEGELEERAKAKLRAKRLDAIVANPLATMGADEIQAIVLTSDGQRMSPPGGVLDKKEFARWLVNWIGLNGPSMTGK